MNTLMCMGLISAAVLTCHGRKVVFEMTMNGNETESRKSNFGYSKENDVSSGRKFSFASYYGDHMVLQGSPQKAVIWGYAPEDERNKIVEVMITPGNRSYKTLVKEDLTWREEIGPIEPGGPYTVHVHLANYSTQLTDVMFGDVWVCSGQSNMHFPLTEIFNSTAEVKDTVNFPDIRLFVINMSTSDVPLADFTNGGLLPWSRPNPETIVKGNFSALCWLYGKYLYQHLQKPIGLLETSYGGTPVEAWSSPDALAKCQLNDSNRVALKPEFLDGKPGPHKYSVLWNAMVHPIINMTIYGVIWYQGESNSGKHTNMDVYNCTFPAMIDDWRKKFSTSGASSQLFPFGFVQLGADQPDYTMTVGFPDIRWHQTADYGYVPNHRQRNVFMAVAMDLPDFTSPHGTVHTRDKQDVAVRLVLSSLAVAYKHNVSFQGPFPVKVTVTGSKPSQKYTQIEVEYTMNLDQRWLDGFEICCAFTKATVCEQHRSWWLPATTWRGSDRVNITHSYASECAADNVVGIRYAWQQSPCPFKKCAIYGAANGLPMPPFTFHGESFRKILVGKEKYRGELETSTKIDYSTYIQNTDGEQYMEKSDLRHTPENNASRTFSFASYYGDHMVLQGSPREAIIWGYAHEDPAYKTVKIFINPGNTTYFAKVTPDLVWTAKIGPVNPGGPYYIEARLGNESVTLKDILFGDVWVCSGQSNMQFSLSEVLNRSAELNDTVNYPDIRMFVVKHNTSDTPLTDLSKDGIELAWSIPSPERSLNFSAVCWLYGKYLYQHLHKPIGLLETSWGGTPVEAWSSPEALKKCGLKDKNIDVLRYKPVGGIQGPQAYSVLWNAMVHPILNMTIYGAIWYQGEANAGTYNRNLYGCTFPAMIDDWRKKFSFSGGTDQLFPFGFVQLAGNRPDYSIDLGFPDIRWHQTANYGYVPNPRQRNVFMSVAMDLPDFTSPYSSIHPRDKQDVAARLVLSGLAVAYNWNVSFQGPHPVKFSVTHQQPRNITIVKVEYTMNLEQLWLNGFEVCCAYVHPPVCKPGKSWWLPTTTMLSVDRANVTESYVSVCALDRVVGLRYAWRESPCPFKNCAIYGADNALPMPIFTCSGKCFTRHLVTNDRYDVVVH